VTCSTCDDYRFVPLDDTSRLVPCPDCAERCLTHGERIIDGRCEACIREAELAAQLLARARDAAAGQTRVEA